MQIKVLKESGYDEALLGLSLSYKSPIGNMPKRAAALAHKQGGHNNFLEMILIWVDITAPRYFWQQADRYRLSAKQSEGTMHTLLKEPLTALNFARPVPKEYLDLMNMHIEQKNLDTVKNLLPEGFLQRRVWLISYKTLQNIFLQRHNHRLEEWKFFCHSILEQIQHPEFIEEK